MTKYRSDIDGLRAVAIVAVLLYHSGLGILTGGFVGVDVFFVISGYLITQIIVAEVDQGAFTISGFYERRVRRIFPALFAVVLVSSVAACLLLLPVDLSAFGKSLLAVTFFASNGFFWWTSGYFDTAASEKPLLHTWSLAVEEQFYIVFPVYLLIIRRYLNGRYLAYTWPVVIGSLCLSAWGVTRHPDATFYLAPTRVWELGVGALLAMGAFPACTNVVQRNMCSSSGALLIAYSAVTFSPRTAFPGLNALFPCVGSGLIIHAGASGRSVVDRVLSTKPVVFIGLISYSLYVWHWPILSFAKHYGVGTLSAGQVAALLAVALVISAASWRYIERPFRTRQWMRSRGQVLTGGGVVMGCTATIGAAFLLTRGIPQRFGPELAPLIAETADTSLSDDTCNNPSLQAIRDGKLCRIGSTLDVPLTFLVWGDSLADVAAPVVGEVADRHGAAGLRATRNSCPPLLGVRREGADGKECLEFNEEVLRQLRSRVEIRDVVLVGRWAKNAEGVPYKHDPSDEPAYLTDALSHGESIEENRPVFSRGLERTLSELERLQKQVWIVSSPPEVGVTVPDVLAKAMFHHQSIDIAPSRADYLDRQAFVFSTLDRLHQTHAFRLLHPEDVFCNDLTCDVVRSGRPLYHDSYHPSRYGARLVAPLFETIFTSR